MVTVGYGDEIPVTNLGRCITVMAMLMGVIVIALPITVVGSTFGASYSEMKDEAECKSSCSLSEAALFMSASSQNSGCHAQQGCHGLMRPTRVKDRISILRDPAPIDFVEQAHCVSKPLEAVNSQGSARQQIILCPALDTFQVGRRSTRRASMAADLYAAKVCIHKWGA